MNFEPLEKIANAVLYEGFLLYPYRKSSLKNQQQWHFGTLGPEGESSPSMMQTQCLVEGDDQTQVDLKVRFLHDEIEREVAYSGLALAIESARREFQFLPVEGVLEIESVAVAERLFRLTVRIRNTAPGGSPAAGQKPGPHMLSVHTLLGVLDGTFVSLLDPSEEYRAAAAACQNVGTWPVLAGREGERQLMLSSPIILYDYPQIAPESVGDFFDGTEIDEMLTLRVLTLSEDEKRELRAGDDHAREILDRTEGLPPEQVAKMHGAIRGLRKARLEFRQGDRVRLRPRKKADIFDIALEGKIAIVESVERDFEDRVHLAVTVEDDPGRDFGIARQIGHRFFFSPEEVELL
jgi:hypothetical protein